MLRTLFALALCCCISLVATAEDKPKPSSKDPVGLWLGTLKVSVIELRLAFQIDKDKDGKLKGKLISLDQNRAVVPCSKVEFAEGKLTLEAAKGAIVYTGAFTDTGKIKGTLKQSGQTFKLELARIDKLPISNRPQTPKGPFPYVSEDVTFENDSAKIKLAGTLTIPKGEGPFPVVILVSGSGPQDRDETIFDHKPFHVLADHLGRKGIACLRYDDRGVGKSGGTFAGSTSADFATDTGAAVKFLKTQKKINPKRIGICGHSEGGIIAPLVAVEMPKDVAFIILLAGPGIPGHQVLMEQITDFSKILGREVAPDESVNFSKMIVTTMKAAKTTEEAKEKLKEAFAKFKESLKDEKEKADLEKAMPAAITRYSDPWLRWFVQHDPAVPLKKVKCPVLALNGEKDIQVKPEQNLSAIKAALKAGGNKDVTAVELKSLNHLFQKCKTGMITEYGTIEETMNPVALNQISDWINARK